MAQSVIGQPRFARANRSAPDAGESSSAGGRWSPPPAGTLLSIGHGYSARALGRRLSAEGWRIVGTSREPRDEPGVEMRVWPGDDLADAITAATHILTSVAPGPDGDPVLPALGDAIARSGAAWVGYLSTTGVYGDRGGDWVDEASPLEPATERGRRRVDAEAAWQRLDVPLHIFRLAGIYGPGRGPFEKARTGRARRIVKPGQVFSRIHVDDIAQVLAASMARLDPGAVYNVCDDEPAPPEQVIAFAARLLGLPVPPAEPFDEAEMTSMARSFYAESKRVRNDRIKQLGVTLRHPTYREGLRAILAEGG